MFKAHVGSFLIVEPDPETAEVLAELCRRIRTARVASSCEEARAVIESGPRLTGMILEADFPDSTCGTELLRDLRAQYPMLPALVLTANTSPEVINRAHRYRAEFHAKPTRRRDLSGFLRRAVAFERVPDQRIAWLVDTTVEQYKLSPRETDLLAAAIAGTPRKDLCEQLGTTENTLKSIAKSALRKLPHASLDDVAREILRHALEGSHATTLEEYFDRMTPVPAGPLTIRPPGGDG